MWVKWFLSFDFIVYNFFDSWLSSKTCSCSSQKNVESTYLCVYDNSVLSKSSHSMLQPDYISFLYLLNLEALHPQFELFISHRFESLNFSCPLLWPECVASVCSWIYSRQHSIFSEISTRWSYLDSRSLPACISYKDLLYLVRQCPCCFNPESWFQYFSLYLIFNYFYSVTSLKAAWQGNWR